jgi:hypothetical protein
MRLSISLSVVLGTQIGGKRSLITGRKVILGTRTHAGRDGRITMSRRTEVCGRRMRRMVNLLVEGTTGADGRTTAGWKGAGETLDGKGTNRKMTWGGIKPRHGSGRGTRRGGKSRTGIRELVGLDPVLGTCLNFGRETLDGRHGRKSMGGRKRTSAGKVASEP